MTEESFKVRYHEMDAESKIPLWVLINYFQESAAEDAHSLSFGWEEFAPKGIAWVVTKFEIKLLKEIQGIQNIKVKTWHCSSDKIQSRRDFVMYNQAGEEIAQGVSWWVILDLEKRRIVRNPPDLMARKGLPCIMESSKVRAPKFDGQMPVKTSEIIARLEDIDSNAHVNNAHFSAWAIDCLPQEVRQNSVLKELVINYKAEVKLGDTVTAKAYADGDGAYWHILTRPADGKEIASVHSVWQKK